MKDELRENLIDQQIDNLLNAGKPVSYWLDPTVRRIAKNSQPLREMVARELDRLRSQDNFWAADPWYERT